MRFTLFILFSILFVIASVSASSESRTFHVNSRDFLPSEYTRIGNASPDDLVDITIALKQQNVDQLKEFIEKVSDPFNPMYGQYLTKDEVRELTSAPPEVQRNVEKWLLDNGIDSFENRGDLFAASARVSDAEKLLNTKFAVYERREETTYKIVRVEMNTPFSYPSNLGIEFVATVADFPVSKAGFYRKLGSKNIQTMKAGNPTNVVVPQTLYNLYNFPKNIDASKSTQSVAEFDEYQGYGVEELKQFYSEMELKEQKFQKFVGPNNGQGAESVLDAQYVTAAGLNAKVNWFMVFKGWLLEMASGLLNSGEKDLPEVISMSWGWWEGGQCQITNNCSTLGIDSIQYINRVNTEFGKLSALGITLLAASGDAGAAGKVNSQCKNEFNPAFPASSTYVLSVGATMFAGNSSQTEGSYKLPKICSSGDFSCATGVGASETVCSYPKALITGGGGFSSTFDQPKHQKDAVQSYLKNGGDAVPPTTMFNGNNRAYPDVSVIGHSYAILMGSQNMLVDGTSASCPVMAGIISQLNTVRKNNGKPVVGLVAPLLYSAAADSSYKAFRDITTGNIKCTMMGMGCCLKDGYGATTGWDAASGLGTPNVQSLISYVKNLKN